MHSSEHSRQSNACVMLIDDNDGLRQLLNLALESAGFEVIQAGTQFEVQRHLAQCRPDAVVINLQRSEADGLDLLTRMRARQNLINVPILFLSGTDDQRLRWQAAKAGADWFGLRPLGMVELQNRVAELIRGGRRAAQSRSRQKPPGPAQVLPLRRTG